MTNGFEPLRSLLPLLLAQDQTDAADTTLDAAGSVVDAASASAGGSMTLLDQIQAGGLIGYIILVMSIVALAITITSLVRVRWTRFVPPLLLAELADLLRRRDLDGALAACERPENAASFLAQVVAAGIRKYRRSAMGPLEFKATMEDAGAEIVNRLYRSTDLLGWIGAAGPLLGLLGTVVGIIQAFEAIGNAKARPDLLAAGISKALVTTAMGLFVAIPATAVFTYLRNRIDHFAAQAGETIDELVAPLEPGNAGAPTGATAVAPGMAASSRPIAMPAGTASAPLGSPRTPMPAAGPMRPAGPLGPVSPFAPTPASAAVAGTAGPAEEARR